MTMTTIKKPVKVFTHNDLDGVGVGIVAQAFFGEGVTDITYCENHEVDSKIREFIESGEYIYFGLVIVGDISFSKEIADIININANLKEKFLLVDHHKTALWLNNYPFAKVEVERDGLKASGTSSLLSILIEMGYKIRSSYNSNGLIKFAEKVRRYDTWDWKNIYSDEKANMLNQLYYMTGKDIFRESILKKLSNKNIHRFADGEWGNLFTDDELMLLAVEENRMNAYVNSRLESVRFCELADSKYAYVYADQYHSQLGNAVCENHDVHFAMIVDINKGKASLRSIGDFDVSSFSKQYGGGGHKNASGFMFEVDHNLVMESVLNKSSETENKSFFSKIVNFIDKLL